MDWLVSSFVVVVAVTGFTLVLAALLRLLQ